MAVFGTDLDNDHFEIESLNFSTYGASFVHIEESGEVVGSLYNYTKKYDEALARRFDERYGPMEDFCQQTASSILGWLNSGLQLYLIKHPKSDLHEKVKYSLHLPQYLSYIFTGSFIVSTPALVAIQAYGITKTRITINGFTKRVLIINCLKSFPLPLQF